MRAPIILCVGLPRSGSTWVYNAVLQICNISGKCSGIYSDDIPSNLSDLISENEIIVIKSHNPTKDLVRFVNFIGGKIVLSVRDPRDCISSLISAFSFKKIEAVNFVSSSAIAIQEIIHSCDCHIIKYEDCSDRIHEIERISQEILYPIDQIQLKSIYDSLKSHSIRGQIESFVRDGLIDPENPSESHMSETHWHPNHIGDGRVGKYHEFIDFDEYDYIERIFSKFMIYFDYKNSKEKLSKDYSNISGRNFLFHTIEGFYQHEGDWGVWTDGEYANLELSFSSDVNFVSIQIFLSLGPSFRGENAAGSGQFLINKFPVLQLEKIPGLPQEIAVTYNCNPNPKGKVNLEFILSGIRKVCDILDSEDTREVGVALREVNWRVLHRNNDSACSVP